MNDKNLSEILIKILEPENTNSEGSITFLNGPWGVGKTHFWKYDLKKFLKKRKCLYISLFGSKDASDIKEKVLGAILAGEQNGSKTSKLRLNFSKLNVPKSLTSMLEKWTGLPIKFDILELDWAKYVVCFDDLERLSSSASMEEILGFINYLSEHKGYRCLVILNEDEMRPDLKKEFLRLREKLSLRTFQILFNLDDRLDNFIDNRSSFYEVQLSQTERELIRRVLKDFQTDNLRTVRFVVDNYLQLRSYVNQELREQDIRFLASMILHEANGHKEVWSFYDFNTMAIQSREYSRNKKTPPPPPDDQTKFYEKYYSGDQPYLARKCIFSLVRLGYCNIEEAKAELFPDEAKLSSSELLALKIRETHFFFSEDQELRDLMSQIESFFKNDDTLSFKTIFTFIKGYSSAVRLLELPDPIVLPDGLLEGMTRAVHNIENPSSYSSRLSLSGMEFLKIFDDALQDICEKEDRRQKLSVLNRAIEEGRTEMLASRDYENSEILENIFTSGQLHKILNSQTLSSDEKHRLLESIFKAMSLNSHSESIKTELSKAFEHLKDIYNTSSEKMKRLRTYRLLQAMGLPLDVEPPSVINR